MDNRRVKMSEIAKAANLSRFSVSRALVGHPSVARETIERVRRIAREMGYVHRGLIEAPDVRNKLRVGLFIPGFDLHKMEYWMTILNGAQEEAARLGLNCIIETIDRGSWDYSDLDDQLSGAIVAGHQPRSEKAILVRSAMPTVLISMPEPLERIDTVGPATREAGHSVGNHLISLGHKAVLCLSANLQRPGDISRFAGLKDAYADVPDASITIRELAADQPALDQLLAFGVGKNDITALFCATDDIAIAVMMALGTYGLSVPGDISVVGFNDYQQASLATPPLTTVRVPMKAIGAAAVRQLIWRINNPTDENYVRQYFVPELIVRGTTAEARLGPSPMDPSKSQKSIEKRRSGLEVARR